MRGIRSVRKRTHALSLAEPNTARSSSESPQIRCFIGAVAATGGRLKAGSINDCHGAPAMCNQAPLLQGASGTGDTHPSDTQNVGQELLGDAEMIGVRPVLGH